MKIPLNQLKTYNEPFFDKQQSQSNAKFDKTLSILSKIFFSIYVLSALIICGIIIWLSILPLKYLLAVIVALIIIAAIMGFFTFKKFAKKSSSRISKIICIFFETIFTIIFAIVFFYLNHTMGFLGAIFAPEYQIDNYYVIVKNDSPFTEIADLSNHTIATYDDINDSYQTAFEKLTEEVKLKPTNYGSVTASASALLDNSADSILINSSLVEVVSEINPEFVLEDLRILKTIEIKTKIDSISRGDIDVTKDSFNIFISGIDTKGDISTVSRSDVNMIVTVNPRTHTILLTSIPRDYYVQLHGTTGLKDKLTHAGLYGINMSIDTLEDLFNIDIDYYIRVNFDSTINIINAIDGVDVTPDLTFSRLIDGVYCYYEEGVVNHLDGLCALRYARERKAYGEGDKHRIQNQQEVLIAIINKLTSSKVILTKYTDILSSMSDSIETNIPSSQIYKLINEQIDSMPSWNIERIAADGGHIDAPTYTISNEYLYVFEPYEESVAEVTAKIKEVMAAN